MSPEDRDGVSLQNRSLHANPRPYPTYNYSYKSDLSNVLKHDTLGEYISLRYYLRSTNFSEDEQSKVNTSFGPSDFRFDKVTFRSLRVSKLCFVYRPRRSHVTN